jgi:hypothetical protein
VSTNSRVRGMVGTVTQFGMTVVRELESRQYGGSRRVFFELQCHCGNTCEVPCSWVPRQKSCGCKVRLPDGVAAFNYIHAHYKRQAKSRGLEWSLSEELFRELTQRDCFYCGVKPSNCKVFNSGTFTYNGVDRIDNDLGYRDGNVVPCCGSCNRAKGVKSLAEFEAWLARVTEFRSRTCPPE